MKRLRSCEGCQRHVYATETVCPFCATALAPLPEPGEISIPAGASRAQRLALAAALGSTSFLACADSRDSLNFPLYGLPVSGQTAAAGTGAPQAGTPGGVQTPVYGAPLAGSPGPSAGRAAAPVAGQAAPRPAGQPAPRPAGEGAPNIPAYGAPIAGQPADDDAGVSEAGSGAAGSGGRGGQMAFPAYGAPIPEYGAPPPPKD